MKTKNVLIQKCTVFQTSIFPPSPDLVTDAGDVPGPAGSSPGGVLPDADGQVPAHPLAPDEAVPPAPRPVHPAHATRRPRP